MPQDGGSVRCLPYPILEDGNLSYPTGEYVVDVKPQDDGTSAIIHHTIRGAPFLDRIIQQGKGKYGCLVSVPLTGYRRLHLSDDGYQQVSWDISVVGEPPMLRPLILSVSEISCRLKSEDGVAEAWQGQNITFPRGARLALSSYMRPSSSLHELLDVRKADLPAGSFKVEACSGDGFYFQVSVAPDLFPFLQNAGEHKNHRDSLLTHVTSRCFEILKSEVSKEEDADEEGPAWWEKYPNLSALAEELRRKNLPVWDDNDFFADEVATQLYPHRPPSEP